MGKVIAIDGPSGAGKSTVSKIVAGKLGFLFLDTGALYRALALHLTRAGLTALSPDDDILKALDGLSLSYRDGAVCLDGEDVSDVIRTPLAGAAASEFSARRPVRDHLLHVQRDMAAGRNIVAEGRDMTTVVFPGAWLKFFLDAGPEERARRRYLQLRAKGQRITLEEALRDVQDRDKRDSSRDVAPLRRAEDAVYIDSTALDLEAVVDLILRAAGC